MTWPSTPSPTGMVRPTPRLRTSVPRVRPSVGRRQMARTRLSPICWATSARTRVSWPSTLTVISRAVLMAGTASGGNSTSTTGPAMATTRPSLRLSWWLVEGVSVTVMASLLRGPLRSPARVLELVVQDVGGHQDVVGQEVAPARLRRPQRLGPTHDLHDLGGDGVLPGPVHGPRVLRDQLFGVVGRRLHGPLLGGQERGR